jgi:hypothetical protein
MNEKKPFNVWDPIFHCEVCGKELELQSRDSLAARKTPKHDFAAYCRECCEKVKPSGYICALDYFHVMTLNGVRLRKTQWGRRFEQLQVERKMSNGGNVVN